MTQPRNRIVALHQLRAGDLVPDPLNFRKHPEGQRGALEEVLAEIGYVDGVVARRLEDGRLAIIDGHLRAELDPDAIVPVIEVDVSAAEAKKVLATKDAISSMAEIDGPSLKGLLLEVEVKNPDLRELLEEMSDRSPELRVDAPDPGSGEPPANPVTRRGDLWILGDHRLLCGDSTSPHDTARVLAGAKPTLLATDPPYGVAYGSLVSGRANQKAGGWQDIEGDDLSDEALEDLLTKALSACSPPVAFLWHSWKRIEVSLRALRARGWRPVAEIVWVKNALVFGRADYQWRHEPCIYAKRDGAPGQDDRTATTVWEFPKPTGTEHPTQKPVELFEVPILNHTKPGDAVYEPFCGSGSQLIAAERLGRRCIALEIARGYCDVSIRRWSAASGKPAYLDEGPDVYKRRSFDEVALERRGAEAAASAT